MANGIVMECVGKLRHYKYSDCLETRGAYCERDEEEIHFQFSSESHCTLHTQVWCLGLR